MSRACKVCLVQHDDEIHAATNRVHAWLRAQVRTGLDEAADDLVLSNGDEPAVPQLNAA